MRVAVEGAPAATPVASSEPPAPGDERPMPCACCLRAVDCIDGRCLQCCEAGCHDGLCYVQRHTRKPTPDAVPSMRAKAILYYCAASFGSKGCVRLYKHAGEHEDADGTCWPEA